MNICWNLGHPICKWVCFFVRTDSEKYSITSLAHQWILCSEWVPSEWESIQLIKTSQLSACNPHLSSPSIVTMSSQCEEEKLCVCEKHIHHSNFKPSLLAHNPESIIKKTMHICNNIFVYNWLFSLVNRAWSLHISLLIQTRQLFHWRKQYYG